MRHWGAWVRLGGGALVLAVLLWRLGSGPFVEGLRTVDATTVALGLLLAVPVTLCSAWRWSVVAQALGARVPLPVAVAASYRAQLLNTTLPGGVAGDVHRGVSHGRSVGDTGRGLRGVAWERLAGQVVQAGIAGVVLVALPSPVRPALPEVALVVGVAVAAVHLVVRQVRPDRPGLVARAVRGAGSDARRILGRRSWPLVVLASVLAVAGHVVTFLVAARTVGVTASPVRLLPIALLVLMAMAVPANVAGWGPREGVAVWLFGAAGLGADAGVATAVVYGVMVLVGSLPGLVVVAASLHRHARSPAVDQPEQPVLQGSRHG
jgi:hypothetical protein